MSCIALIFGLLLMLSKPNVKPVEIHLKSSHHIKPVLIGTFNGDINEKIKIIINNDNKIIQSTDHNIINKKINMLHINKNIINKI